MFVHPNQLVEKCLIVSDIYGPSNYPIIKKDTVITATHIKVLKSFLIDLVEVDPNLVNGQPFKPNQVIKVEEKPIKKRKATMINQSPFFEHYQSVVSEYEKLFLQWQSGSPLDINKVRQIILPLLERVDQHQGLIFLLGKYTTKDKYLYQHSVAASLLSTILAKRLGFERESIQIGIAAFIADSGMSKINQRILNLSRKLTHAELKEIKKHTTYSYRLIEKNAALTRSAKLTVLQHHERVDGKGYPLGLPKERINPYAMIIAIADAFHAMTSNRLYQERVSFFEAIIEMKKLASKQFDERYLKVFTTCLEDALLDRKVYLSNEQSGTIVALRFTNIPEVIIQVDNTYEIISLLDQKDIKVKSII